MMVHAEVDQVWPRDGRIRITGRLTDGSPQDLGADWQLLLILRDHEDQQLRYAAPLEDDRFETSLAIDDLALDGLPSATWDLHLSSGTGPGEVRVRVGKHLDDIPNKKKIMIFPAQTVTSDEDATVVRPFYTVKDNLSVECLPGDIPLRDGEIALERPEWIG
jgi:hypothetical protein